MQKPSIDYRLKRTLFFFVCLLCYSLLLIAFSIYSLPQLSLAQGCFLLAKNSLLEFIIAYHLFEWLRFKVRHRLTRELSFVLSFASIFFIFGLNLIMIQVFHSFAEPVPLTITFVAIQSLLNFLPEQLIGLMIGILFMFAGISLAHETIGQSKKPLNS